MQNRRHDTGRLFKIMSSALLERAPVEIQQTDKICAGFYAAVLSLPLDREFSLVQFEEGVSYLTESKFSIEANSLFPIGNNIFRCVLASTTGSKPYTDESVQGYHAIRANVYYDPDTEQYWNVEGEGEDRRLIQKTQSDYGAILEAKRARTPIIASDNVINPYEEHDYAYFFNHTTLAMDFGYVVNRGDKDYVFSRKTDKLVPLVTPTQVIIAGEMEKLKNPARQRHNMVVAGNFSIDNYLDYLRAMYGADNPYFKAYEKAVRERLVQ